MSEPITDSGELSEAEERGGEFLVAGADAAEAFESAEEIFDLVPVTIVAAMESDKPDARAFRRDAPAGVLVPQPDAKGIGSNPLSPTAW